MLNVNREVEVTTKLYFVEETSEPFPLPGRTWSSNRYNFTILPKDTFADVCRRAVLPFREVALLEVIIQRTSVIDWRKVEMVSGYNRRMLPYLNIPIFYIDCEVIFVCKVNIKALQ